MFDPAAISNLDRDAAADALVASRVRLIEEEAEQFVLAAHWADLHASEFVAECRAALPGLESSVPAGADGCPEMDEFAAAELAALLGRTTGSGQQLIADAVNLRHRHPMLWAGILEGSARTWVAARVARLCAAARLTRGQAGWVDAQTTPWLMGLPVGRFFGLVEAKIIEAEPGGGRGKGRSCGAVAVRPRQAERRARAPDARCARSGG